MDIDIVKLWFYLEKYNRKSINYINKNGLDNHGVNEHQPCDRDDNG